MSLIDVIEEADKWLKLSLKGINKDPVKTKDQQKMLIGSLRSLIFQEEKKLTFPSIAQIIEAPNGAGKSAVIVALALVYSQINKRVLILEPNKVLIEEIIKYFKNSGCKEKKEFVELKPYSDAQFESICELDTTKGERPRGKICEKWNERCLKTGCIMMKHLQNVIETNIVIATHHKMIYDRRLIEGKIAGKFDLIIIDEFHMIPEVVMSYSERTFTVDSFLEKAKKLSLKPDITEDIKLLATEYYEYKNKGQIKEQKDIVTDMLDIIKSNNLESKFFGSFNYFNRKITSNGICFSRKLKDILLKDVQFALFSATIINAKEVIYDLLKIDGVKIPHKLEFYEGSWERLSRICIFGSTDLPRLKKSNLYEYKLNREITVDYLLSLLDDLEKTGALDRYNVLVLCNAISDSDYIREKARNTRVEDRFLDISKIEEQIEKELDLDDSGAIATRLGNEVMNILENKTKIILVTGSSVFWQGVNLKNVQLIFILTLPYRPPTEKEQRSPRRGWSGHYSGASQFQYMTRRLSQGIGRLCREKLLPNMKEEIPNWGLAVVLDGRFDTIRTGIKKQFPKVYRNNFHFFPRDSLKNGIINMINHSIKHDSPYSPDGQLRLTEFFNKEKK
ncbi:MAG: helicase C-terminal domain-containing protein [Candidatus Heimdallarchaeaceae archaeon]